MTREGREGLDDFTCAACQRHVDQRWTFRIGKTTSLWPICYSCERWYSGRVGQPSGGSLRDRREVRRGVAIAEALYTEAMRQKWNPIHANA